MIRAGCFVQCPGCMRRLAKVVRDLIQGERILAEAFDGIGDYEIRNGDMALCPLAWSADGMICIEGYDWTTSAEPAEKEGDQCR